MKLSEFCRIVQTSHKTRTAYNTKHQNQTIALQQKLRKYLKKYEMNTQTTHDIKQIKFQKLAHLKKNKTIKQRDASTQ